ncbi:MAG: oxidase, partial [Rhodoferax sp.]|nr:oxidase [Rhodoferax sp.]
DTSLLPRREGTDGTNGAGHQGPPLPVVVYGGGETGCETAEFLSAAGWHVVLVTRSRLDDLARAAEPMYRRQLRKRLAANGHIRIMPLTTLAAIHGDRVSLQLAEGDDFDLRATALVMAQGRASSDVLVAPLRAAGVVHAVVGDARTIGRIGDAVHAAHDAVRVLAGGLSRI